MLRKHLKWDITGNCNLRCKHCLTGDKYRENDRTLSREERGIIVDRLKEGGVRLVNLLGGEPLLLGDDLLDLARRSTAAGVTLTLNTNGTLLKEGFTRKLIEAGCRGFTVSLDGPAPEVHDEIRGKGTFQRTVANLMRLKEVNYFGYRVSLTINTVLTRLNMASVDRMLDLVLTLGAQKWILLPLVVTGYAADHEAELSLDGNEKIVIGEILAERLRHFSGPFPELEVDLQFSYPPLRKLVESQTGLSYRDSQHCCMAGTTLGFLDPLGNLYGCDRLATAEYADIRINGTECRPRSLLEHTFSEIWHHPFYNELFAFVSSDQAYRHYYPCNRCEFLQCGFCIPCPLFGLKYSKITYDFCLRAERELGPRALQLEGEIRKGDFRYSGQFPTLGLVSQVGHPGEIDVHRLTRQMKKSEWVRENIQWHGAELYDARQDKFFRLNFLGKEIWCQVGADRTISQILEHTGGLLPEGEREAFRQYGLALMAEMVNNGLVTIIS